MVNLVSPETERSLVVDPQVLILVYRTMVTLKGATPTPATFGSREVLAGTHHRRRPPWLFLIRRQMVRLCLFAAETFLLALSLVFQIPLQLPVLPLHALVIFAMLSLLCPVLLSHEPNANLFPRPDEGATTPPRTITGSRGEPVLQHIRRPHSVLVLVLRAVAGSPRGLLTLHSMSHLREWACLDSRAWIILEIHCLFSTPILRLQVRINLVSRDGELAGGGPAGSAPSTFPFHVTGASSDLRVSTRAVHSARSVTPTREDISGLTRVDIPGNMLSVPHASVTVARDDKIGVSRDGELVGGSAVHIQCSRGFARQSTCRRNRQSASRTCHTLLLQLCHCQYGSPCGRSYCQVEGILDVTHPLRQTRNESTHRPRSGPCSRTQPQHPQHWEGEHHHSWQEQSEHHAFTHSSDTDCFLQPDDH